MTFIVAKNTSGETLTRGDVVTFSDSYPQGALTVPGTVTVATQVPVRLLIYAPGAERLPACIRALSGDLDATAPLGVVIGEYGGGANVADNGLVIVQTDGFLDLEIDGSPDVGASVYVTDAGALSTTAGSGSEVVGHVHEASGGRYRVWIDAAPVAAADAPFVQAGSGASSRTFQAKARETISIDDYSGDTYTALLAAIAQVRSIGGGTILIPGRVATYDIDPVAPIEIDFSNLHFVGQGANRSVLRNVSATGVDLFIFKTAIRTQIHFDKSLKIQSDATAGHVFTADAASGLSFSTFECPINQLNPARSGFDFDFSGTAGGLFNCQFRGANWEHGSGTTWGQVTAPTVPFSNIRGNNNRVVDCTWEQLRMQSRFATVPFFWLENYGDSAWFYRNTIREIETERARTGFFYIAGCLGTTFERINHYDCDDIDGHLIETATGTGAKACEQTLFSQIKRVSGLLVGVTGTEQSVSGITLAGTTATATATAHGYGVGRPIFMAGADQAEYNGRFVITAKTDDTFDYEVDGTPASPATGTIEVAESACDVRLGPDDSQALFVGLGGTTSRQQEVDLRTRGCLSLGATTSRTTFHRISDTSATFIGGGASAGIQAPSIQGTNSQAIDTPSGIQLGTGGYILKLLEFSQALDFGSIAAQTSAELTVTVTGAVAGDEVVANPNSSPETGLVWNAWVSATDTVTLRAANVTVAAIDPANRTWKFRVYQH